MATEENKKLVRIVDRIVEKYQEEIYQNHIRRDATLISYEKALDKATAGKKFLSIAIIKKQMLTRIQQISNDYAARKIQAIANSGELGAYLDEDDHLKYEELRLKLYLAYDALDYILKDMTSFFHSIGFDEGEVKIFREVENARKTISEWGASTTNVKGSFAEELIDTEGERIYKFINRRFPFLNKAMEKAKP